MEDFGQHVESCSSVTKTLHLHCHHAYGHQNWQCGDLSWGTTTHKVLTRLRIIKRCCYNPAFSRNGENEYCQTPSNHFTWDRTQLISNLLIKCTPKIDCKRKRLQLVLKASTKNITEALSKSLSGETRKSKTWPLRKLSIRSSYFLDMVLNGTVEQSHFKVKKKLTTLWFKRKTP